MLEQLALENQPDHQTPTRLGIDVAIARSLIAAVPVSRRQHLQAEDVAILTQSPKLREVKETQGQEKALNYLTLWIRQAGGEWATTRSQQQKRAEGR
ncbi:MAG TPA: hypothetical protein V6C65_39815 [Allocoleopsis sp.]